MYINECERALNKRSNYLYTRIDNNCVYFNENTKAKDIIPFIKDMCIWGYTIGYQDAHENELPRWHMSKEDIERILDELIKEAEENQDLKAENALSCAKKELLR